MQTSDFLQRLGGYQDSFYLARKGEEVQKLRGSFAKLGPLLQGLNVTGRDVWYAVNAFVPGAPSKSTEYVSHYRAHYADVDVIGAAHPSSAGLPIPTLTIESSPGKRQHLWVFTEPVAVADYPTWHPIQDWVTKQVPGCDTAAKDSARVLRLPGFTNNKYPARPLVRVIAETTLTYTPGDFMSIAPVFVPAPIEKAEDTAGSAPERFFGRLAKHPFPLPKSGARNPFVFKIAAWAVRDLGLPEALVTETLFNKMLEEQGVKAYDYKQIASIVRNASAFSRGIHKYQIAPPSVEIGE